MYRPSRTLCSRTGRWWSHHLPDVVEAIYGSLDQNFKFLQSYGLDASTHPHVDLNTWNWDSPIH